MFKVRPRLFSGRVRPYLQEAAPSPRSRDVGVFVYFPGQPPRMVCLLYIRGMRFEPTFSVSRPFPRCHWPARAGAGERAHWLGRATGDWRAPPQYLRYTSRCTARCTPHTGASRRTATPPHLCLLTVLYCTGRAPRRTAPCRAAPHRTEPSRWQLSAEHQTCLVRSEMPLCLGVSSDTSEPRS